MIKQEEIFKNIIDKIDYDEFIQLVEVHRKKYQVFVQNQYAFYTFFEKDIVFNIYINEKAELTLERKDKNLIFFTINSKIDTNNIFTKFLCDNLSDQEFKIKLKEMVHKYKEKRIVKIKQKTLNNKLNMEFILNQEQCLIYLLKDQHLIDMIGKTPYLYIEHKEFINKYTKHYGITKIIKLNSLLSVDYRSKYFQEETLIHNESDNIFFDKAKTTLFDDIRNIQSDRFITAEKYLILIYGLYFKLFSKEELKTIVSFLHNTNQLYIYDQDNDCPDFKKEFVVSLLLKNNVDFKVKNIKYYNENIKKYNNDKIKTISFYRKNDTLDYLLQLIDDLMNYDYILFSNNKLYSHIQEKLLTHIDFFTTFIKYDKKELLNKINTCMVYNKKYY